MNDLNDICIQLLKRLLPKHFDQIIPLIDKNSINKINYYEISTPPNINKIQIKANSVTSFGCGLKYYLRTICKYTFLWGGKLINNAKLPEKLPLLDTKIYRESHHKIRYYMNYCTFGYSTVWWDWARWEYELDLMALNGINLCLMIVGQEGVWYNTLLKLGFSKSEILKWISVPTHLPWQWMGNIHSFGSPIPEAWITSHIELGQKIIKRMRELEIEPVLQGYYGIIPEEYKAKFPKAKILEQGKWIDTLYRPSLLSMDDQEYFPIFAQTFYKEQELLFGHAKYLAADPFHEGGLTHGLDITKCAALIQYQMLKYNPSAIWVLQAWMENPQPLLLEGLIKSHVLILDLYCDNTEMCWEKRSGFNGVQWVFCIIHNFGGNPGMFGSLETIWKNYGKALSKSEAKNMVGIGEMMEGIENNQIVYDFVWDLSWNYENIKDLNSWTYEYIEGRYNNKISDRMKNAWEILLQTVYGKECTTNSIKRGSIIGRRFKIPSRIPCYSLTEIFKAWELFLLEGIQNPEYKSNEAFKYDLLMLTKQVLTICSFWIYKNIQESIRSQNLAKFLESSNVFRVIILDLDKLLSSRPEFLFGKQLENSEKWAANIYEADLYKWAQKTLITLWDNVPNSQLNDYANKEYAGLLSDYYYARWDYYFKQVKKSLSRQEKIDYEKINKEIGDWEKVWADLDSELIYDCVGDTIEISLELFQKYSTLKPAEKQKCTRKDYIGKWEYLDEEDNKKCEIEFFANNKFEIIKNAMKVKKYENCTWDCVRGNAIIYDIFTNPVEVYSIREIDGILLSHCSLMGPSRKITK